MRSVKNEQSSGSGDSTGNPGKEDLAITNRRNALAQEGAGGSPVQARTSVWKRFRQHTLALIGLIVLVFLSLTAVAAPVISQHPPNSINLQAISQSPNTSHWLGTDTEGRDIFSRLMHAGRVSLLVGVSVVLISLLVGLPLGAIAGYLGGFTDACIMRFVDVVLSFPGVLIVITLIAMLGPSLLNLIIVMGLLNWPPITRLLRADFLSLRERDFTLAARAIGVPNARIVARHLLPNAMAPIIVAATFGVASAILLEAGLSFLGLGVQVPTASWGNMLSAAQTLSVLEGAPWRWVPPGVMIALAVLAINFIGDGLRDALDPRMRT